MLSGLLKLVKIPFLPIYNLFAKPIEKRVLAQVEAEILQIHQHYVEFQAQYHQKITNELLNLSNQIDELKHHHNAEGGQNKHD